MSDSKTNIIDDLLAKTDIVELINETTPLQKKGKNYFGLCPFHHEKTPSFSVEEDKKLYYCFSCKAGGNALTFVKETKGYSSAEAIRYLADRAGITLEEARFEKPHKRLLDINEEAMHFYEVYLNHTKTGTDALHYLSERKLTDDTIKHFNLGLAPKQKDALFETLTQKSMLASDMADLGLITDEETPRDVFRNRIMFPIQDEDGHVLGFSGRTFEDSDKTLAKYMNTTSTPVFDKSDILYNLHRAKPAIKQAKRMVIFEGFMDVMQAYQAGIKEGVAIMGTALTDKHVKRLKALTNDVVLCFDGDQAGQDATRKFVSDLEKAHLNIKVALLEEGVDPDDFIRTQGAERFRALIEDAQDSKNYLYTYHKRNVNPKKITEVEQFKKRIFDLIVPLSNLEQNYFIRKMADDLAISAEIIALDFQDIRRKHLPQYKKLPKVEITDKFKKAERGLIFYFFKDRYYEKKFRLEFKDALFADKHARDIQLEIFEYYRMNKRDLCIVPELFVDTLNEAQKAYFKKHVPIDGYPHSDLEFEDYLSVMREQSRRSDIKRLKDKLNEATSIDEKIEYRKEIDAIIRGSKHGKRKNYPRTH